MSSQLKMHIKRTKGFTLLELIAVLAIIGVVSLFALPAITEWSAKRSFDKSLNDIKSYLLRARMDSMTRGITTKITTSRNNDNYAMTVFYNNNPVTACDELNGWNNLESYNFDINSQFEITGSGIGDICFFRDGSSSGGQFNINQKNGQTNLGASTINIILTTGVIDAVQN